MTLAVTNPRTVPAELRRAGRSIGVLGPALIVVLMPAAIGILVREEYALSGSLEFFGLMLRNFVPLLFPVLVTVVYLPRLSDEFANGFTGSVRTRTTLRTYLGSRIATAALLSFLTFTAMIVVCWLVAFVIGPLVGMNEFENVLPAGAAPDALLDPVSRATFTQLYADPPVLYGVVYAVWVGLNAALVAVFGTLSLILISNRFVALAVPTVAFLVVGFALQVLGLAPFTPTFATFPFGLAQQPLWTPFVPFMALAIVCAGLWVYVERRNFETSGLD
ncbi:hypothetical protein [Isoptericola sp. NPDC056134]|uniref:hypothetical protein n=1 Tax=Isoptericola sp. NPDC056134 TaxID=3345723 RepID=UPI0035E4EBD0